MSIYDQIKHDIAQDYYQNAYSNDGQRFVAWYLRNIYGLDTAEAKACLTDGAGDKHIDSVYINHDEQKVYIIQGKFTQKAKTDSSPLMEIYSAWTQLKDLQHLQDNANGKLSWKIGEISSALDDGCELCFELVMTSELTKAAQKDAERYRQEMADSEDLNAALSVIDTQGLTNRYMQAVNDGTNIKHDFTLEAGMYMQVEVAGKKAVIAVLPLLECLNIPGIQDGSLFRRNVRQSLGDKVKVNKEIAKSLKDNPKEFFFLHNGITATCSSLRIDGGTLHVDGLSVVNGCQSLTTIFGNSETVKKSGEGHIIFRFYEITENDQTDTISQATNSQNAVKPRDLRSNDKHVLTLKKAYEHCYPDGLFITKRGEKAGSDKNKAHVVELGTLAKMLITWHVQNPTIIHVETKIFSDYFRLLFEREYTPENVQALNEIFTAITEKWTAKSNNPLDLEEALFKQKAYAPYWHLFALSVILCRVNNHSDMIPIPCAALKVINGGGVLDALIELAGYCVNDAFTDDVINPQDQKRGLDPHNWPKSRKSLASVRSAIERRLKPSSPNDRKYIVGLKEKLKMSKRDFEPVWGTE